MPFLPKKTKQKVDAGYKTIYLRQSLIAEIEKIATENYTSFNNVVVSMIEYCQNIDEVTKLTNYRKMYLEMIHGTEQAIQILTDIQRQCEEIYINSSEVEDLLIKDEEQLETASSSDHSI